MEPKQVIVVRKDLNMRKGKIAAQVAHASNAVILKHMVFSQSCKNIIEARMLLHTGDPMHQWLCDGVFKKVVVSCNSEQEIKDIQMKCLNSKILCAIITDAGRTEFHGVPTVTCIAVGPDDPDKIDKITGHLPLM